MAKRKPMTKKTCVVCGKEFEARAYNQVCCSYNCLRERNRQMVKEKYWEKKKKEGFPKFHCPYCHKYMQLDFSPLVEFERWKNFVCPFCGYKQTFAVKQDLQTS